MKNVDVFDVVELKNSEKGTVLQVCGNNCLVEIPDEEKKQQLINLSEIDKIIRKHNM